MTSYGTTSHPIRRRTMTNYVRQPASPTHLFPAGAEMARWTAQMIWVCGTDRGRHLRSCGGAI
jgi:hypothetical protein